MNCFMQKKTPFFPFLLLKDLLKRYKFILLLFILIFCAANAVIWTTNQNRKLQDEKSRMILAKDGLESEWQSLILETSTLTSDYIIEQKAEALGLVPIGENEIVIIIK